MPYINDEAEEMRRHNTGSQKRVAELENQITERQQAEEKLGWIKQTIDTHRYQISIWVPLVFGVLFILRGIIG